jgi:hypothetical protein
MLRKIVLSLLVPALFSSAVLLGGCGSGKKEGGQVVTITPVASAAKLGNANCFQCHNSGKDLTMLNDNDARTIGAVYQDSVHFNPLFAPNDNGQQVGCESCHGGGEFHWGTGPLAHPVPDYSVCQTCHKSPYFDDPSAFMATSHANTGQNPDRYFSQGGTGVRQASNNSVPEVVSGTTTPVTVNQHIEECSVCHNANQRFVYDNAGNLLKPDPADMPNPTVSCANCHDAHQVGKIASVSTRAAGSNPAGNVVYQIFRKSQIAGSGAWNRPEIYKDPATTAPGPQKQLSTELICAACHTKGQYKYARTATHQTDVYSQWKTSGHGDREATAWHDFTSTPGVGHQTSYPLDLAVAANSAPTQCFKCHNGISSIDYLGDIDPVTRRPVNPRVVWGDAPAVCITCHDPHANGTGHTSNVRTPSVMTNYSGAGVGVIFGNVFLDNQPLPTTAGNASICIFCHQGRESGLTLFRDKLAPGRPLAGAAFKNAHYLGTAAMLWGANAYEYANKSYSVNVAHQSINCTGCHMANPTDPVRVGGHTWRPNPSSCSGCHAAITAATDLSLEPGAGFLAGNRATGDTTNYSGKSSSIAIAAQIRDLQNYIIRLLAAQAKPVYYDDTTYPYFHTVPITAANGAVNNHGSSTAFTAWTLPVYKAAFNLGIAVKGLPSAGASPTNTYVLSDAGIRVPDTSATLVPNKSAAVHNYKYIIQLLMDSYSDLYNNTPAASIPAGLPTPAALNLNRPVGARQAVNYGAYVKGGAVTYGGVYSANQ